MTTSIKIIAAGLKLRGQFNDSTTAKKILSRLPLEFAVSRWGDEYYGSCGVKAELAPDARTLMQEGEIAYWPPGQALCFFFGPTPASSGAEPRAASEVNPIGKIIADWNLLKPLGNSLKVRLEKE
jgi:hypothetical protein